MSTHTKPELSLSPIIRPASEADRRNADLKPHIYWLRSSGEIRRDAPLAGIFGGTPFVVSVASVSEPMRVAFNAEIPVSGTDRLARIACAVSFTCQAAQVHHLIHRWTRVKNPDEVFSEDVLNAIRDAATAGKEADLHAAEGVAGGGAVGKAFAATLKSLWGFDAELRFTFLGREALTRRELSITTQVRLRELEYEASVTAVVELLPTVTSLLLALANVNAEDTLRDALEGDLKAFYPEHVGIDELLDPRSRAVWKPKLESAITARVASYGRNARLVRLSETPPAIPGDADELVRVTLADFRLPDDHVVGITLVARLRLQSRSRLLRAMASRAGVSFNTEFERIARNVFGHAAAGWFPQDLLYDRRSAREEELFEALKEHATPYGYELVHCVLTTTRDPEKPTESDTIVEWRGFVPTAAKDVTVDVEVTAQLKYRVGVHGRRPVGQVLESIRDALGAVALEHLPKLQPSTIYRKWLVPHDGSVSLQDEVKNKLMRLLKNHADDPSVIVKLHGQVEFVQAFEALLRASLVCKGVKLNPDNVPGEVTVDLSAPVTGLPEKAWGELARVHAIGERWDPIALATADIQRLMQSAFAQVLDGNKQNRISKHKVIEDLRAKVKQQILDRYAIDVDPEIRFYSAPEVIDFYKRQANEAKVGVQYYFDLRESIAMVKQAKRLERVRLIGEGLGAHPELSEVEDAIRKLDEELKASEEQTRLLQKENADALSYVRLLSAPSDPLSEDVTDGVVVDGAATESKSGGTEGESARKDKPE